MLSQSRLDKISEMENLLNEAESFLVEAEQFLNKWQDFLPKMKTLEHYYFDVTGEKIIKLMRTVRSQRICLVAY